MSCQYLQYSLPSLFSSLIPFHLQWSSFWFSITPWAHSPRDLYLLLLLLEVFVLQTWLPVSHHAGLSPSVSSVRSLPQASLNQSLSYYFHLIVYQDLKDLIYLHCQSSLTTTGISYNRSFLNVLVYIQLLEFCFKHGKNSINFCWVTD